jgi:hypothetical protein
VGGGGVKQTKGTISKSQGVATPICNRGRARAAEKRRKSSQRRELFESVSLRRTLCAKVRALATGLHRGVRTQGNQFWMVFLQSTAVPR